MQREHVEPDEPVQGRAPLVVGEVRDPPGDPESRGVDQADHPLVVEHDLAHGVETRVGPEVGGEDLGGQPGEAAQLVGELGEGLLAAGDEHRRIAARCERPGDGGADPGGRAGDEDVGVRTGWRQWHEPFVPIRHVQ